MKKLKFLSSLRITCIVLLTSCTLGLFAAENYVIEGKLQGSHSKEPIANATVKVKGTNLVATSDSTGYFKISGAPTETAKLIVSCVGCVGKEIDAKAGAVETLIVDDSGLKLNDVVVNGDAYNPMKTPTIQPLSLQTAVETVGSEKMKEIGAVNAMQALKYTVAGNLTDLGRKRRNMVTVRGSSVDNAIDGISFYQATQLPDAINALSTGVIEEVEITRSSNALLMGYSGLNGVVNYKTKSFDKFTTLLDFESGSYGKVHGNATVGGKFKGFKYVFSASKDQTDGPKDRNAAEDMLNLYGKLEYNYKDKLNVGVQHFYMNGMREFAQMQDVNLPNATLPASNKAQIWKFDPLTFRITTAKLVWTPTKRFTSEAQFYYIDGQRNYQARAYKVANGKVTTTIPDYTTTKEPDYYIGGSLIEAYKLSAKNTMRLALMGSKRTTPSQTTPSGTVTNTDIRSFSASLLDEHDFGKLNVNGGVKFMCDYYKRYAPGSTVVYVENEWQPVKPMLNLGASYKATKTTTINFLASAGVMTPPSKSIAFTVSGKDTSFVSPKNETRVNIDLGISQRIKYVGEIVLTTFFINRTDATAYSGVLYTDDYGMQQEYMKNLDIKTYGIEAQWKSPRYLDLISFDFNTTLMRSFSYQNGTETRYETLPKTMINGAVNISKYGFVLSANGKSVSEYEAPQTFLKLTSGKVYVGDYTTADLYLGYTIPKTKITLYGRCQNIGDVKYCNYSPVYPDFGRQYFGGVKAEF